MKTDTKLLLMKISALRHEKAALMDAIQKCRLLLHNAENAYRNEWNGHNAIECMRILDLVVAAHSEVPL